MQPRHELQDQKYSEHACVHSTGQIGSTLAWRQLVIMTQCGTGMRRVGIDDSRLFLLDGDPFALFAGVAPAGQVRYFLVSVPESS